MQGIGIVIDAGPLQNAEDICPEIADDNLQSPISFLQALADNRFRESEITANCTSPFMTCGYDDALRAKERQT
jgi:hypothetical protein